MSSPDGAAPGSLRQERPPPVRDIVIRPFAPADLAAVTALWIAAWQVTMRDIDFSARGPWLAAWLDGLAAAGATILCATDGALTGAAVLGFVTVDPATRYLDQLAAAPEAFGRGVAPALLSAAKRLSPQGLALDVNQENPRAVRFYRREGFAVVSGGVNASGRPIWRMAWPG